VNYKKNKCNYQVTLLFNILLFLYIILSVLSLNCKENKFLFDDFNYQSVKVFKNIDSSGSMFSRNIWKFGNQDTALKAWFKYNSGDIEFPTENEMKVSNDGFILNIKPSNIANRVMPSIIMSSFHLKYGTYASLVKFSEFDENDMITQAFWLVSPVSFIFIMAKTNLRYFDEIDFEWNNHWEGGNKYLMPAGCNMKNARRPSQMYLDCMVRDSLGNCINLKQCTFPLIGKPVITNRWALCIFVIDSIKNTTQFGIYCPDDGNGNEIWAGDKYIWGNYFTIYNYSFNYPEIVVYDVASVIPEVHKDCPLEADWFYYDERTNIDYSDILNIVKGFKTNNIERIFNGDIFFNEIEYHDNKDNFYFVGDSIIEPDKEYKWLLQSDCKRWWGHYNMKEMKYRFHNVSGYWEDWNPLITAEPVLKAAAYQDSLEIYASFFEYWSKYEDSARFKVYIKNSEKKQYKVIHDLQIFPNPFKEFSLITYSISEDSKIKIRIADILGREVYDENQFRKSGKYTLDLSHINLSFGFYVCMIYTDNQVESLNFLRR
jgi:hypothetical protein